MYGNTLRNSGIPWLRSYHEALQHYENVQPVRGGGRNAGKRPLGARNKPHFQIVRGLGGLAETVVCCRLYRTDVITFFPDGRIRFNTDKYNTTTTANFISQVLGRPCGQYDNRLVLHVDGGEYTVNEGLVLRNEDGVLKVLSSVPDIVHTVDRKAMNAVRREHKEFITYVDGMLKLHEHTFVRSEIRATLREGLGYPPEGVISKININSWGPSHMTTASLLDREMELIQSGTPENWYLAFLWLVHSADSSWYDGRLTCTRESVMRMFTDFLIAKNPKVLVPKLIRQGKVQADRYKRFKLYKEEA